MSTEPKTVERRIRFRTCNRQMPRRRLDIRERQRAGVYRESRIAAAGFTGGQRTNAFDESCEHVSVSRKHGKRPQGARRRTAEAVRVRLL